MAGTKSFSGKLGKGISAGRSHSRQKGIKGKVREINIPQETQAETQRSLQSIQKGKKKGGEVGYLFAGENII